MENKKDSEKYHEGDPCHHCGTPLKRREKPTKGRRGRKYYFAYYFVCPQCHKVFYVDSAKRFFEDSTEAKSPVGDTLD